MITVSTLAKAFALHMAAVLPTATGHSIHLDDQYEDDIVRARIPVREGSSPIPDGPGLGVEVDEAAYRARLAHELEVIIRMGFAGYFLIVWDFIREAKQQRIPVGPGRGSGAGSLVAYALGITELDPIPHQLL